MVGRAGGSATPSYNQAVTEGGKEAEGKQFKIPMEKRSKARGKKIMGLMRSKIRKKNSR